MRIIIPWTKEDLDLLKECEGKNIEEIILLFPNRKRKRIIMKCRDLNIKIIFSPKGTKWSEDETNLLLKVYKDKSAFEISKIITTKTTTSIRNRCCKLNLQINKLEYHYDNKDFITCKLCGIEKEYTGDNFPKNSLICKECSNKLNNIEKYKRKHNIILDFNKMYNTYSIIEWYEIFRTNKIKCIPKEIFTNENILIIIKYVLTEILNKKSRKEILEVSRKELYKYRLAGMLTKIDSNYVNILNQIFPEFNYKIWEMNGVIGHFWEDINNVDDYMRWFVENEVKIVDAKNEVSRIFTVSSLRSINNHILNYLLLSMKWYSSYYEWLNKLYPEWELTTDHFKQNIAKDGETLDSMEELKVYEFIKCDLLFDIKTTNNTSSKDKFYNLDEKENYVPDFISKFINPEIKLIIEYFGFWKDNPDNHIFIEYHDKTLRKIKFFNSLDDYKFIGLFPSDLKNNFQGVREKLTSFLLENNIPIPSPLKEVV